MVWMTFSCLIMGALACNLPGRVGSEVGEQIEEEIKDQLQEALVASGNEELVEELGEIMEQLSGESLGELVEGFSVDNWTSEDIPLPPDAEVLAGYTGKTEGDFVMLKTSMSIDEAEAWMLAKLKGDGWEEEEMEVLIDQARAFNFSKVGEGLTLVMNSSTGNVETHIWIAIYPLNQ